MMSSLTHQDPLEIVVRMGCAEPPRRSLSTGGGTECTYDPENGGYRARFGPDSPRPSEAVVNVVAAIEETDPVALSPLFEAVEPDALDALADSVRDGDDESLRLTFSYEGHQVTVTA